MIEGVGRFFRSLPNDGDIDASRLVDFFAYYLAVELHIESFNARTIDECFAACDLAPPKRTAAYLSEGVRAKPPKYVKVAGGYKLQHHYKKVLSEDLGVDHAALQTSVELRRLEVALPEGPTKQFLGETIDCFEVGANRATVVMCWILTVDHLHDLVMSKHLQLFNASLAGVTDKRVKVGAIQSRDDFGDIPEGKFVELLRASGVISGDVKKILDAKLATRNSSAHPSGIEIKRSKVIDFVEDLVENVILKYPL